MQKIDDNCRYTIHDNEIWASFMDWTVKITLDIQPIQSNWLVWFSEGDGGKSLLPLYCNSLEEAFEVINKYKSIIHFKDLEQKVLKDWEERFAQANELHDNIRNRK
jgi:hypothetical protein